MKLYLPNFLAVAAYPKLSENDKSWIEGYRKEHDAYYDLVPAHFSFVFPDFNNKKDDFIKEVILKSKGVRKIDFNIRSAIRNNDRTNEYWHVLLVPDVGFSEVVKLHGLLYSGLFKKQERLDLDFIPHIAIANSTIPEECKQMVNEVNAMNIDISGTIDKLDIIQYRNKKISTIDVVNLI